MSAVLEQREGELSHKRPHWGPREELEIKRKAGRLVVFHITDILVNIRHRDTLREMVGKKLDLLLGMGFKPDDVQVSTCSDTSSASPRRV